jgi:hypothetical protein
MGVSMSHMGTQATNETVGSSHTIRLLIISVLMARHHPVRRAKTIGKKITFKLFIVSDRLLGYPMSESPY